MGRPKVGQATQEFRALTEGTRGKRRRIRTEFVPELAAWLVLVGRRYTAGRVKLEQEFRATSDETIRGTIAELKAYERAIQQLCNVISDEWGQGPWEQVTTEIAERFGIVVGRDLPPTIRQTDAPPVGDSRDDSPLPVKG